MRILGPETPADRELREWFESQERGNIERLEAGAQTIIQLVTGLYGVLFAVLALSNQPAYLQNPIVRWAGTVGVCTFFGSLLAAMLVAIPRRIVYQKDNLTEMQRVYRPSPGTKGDPAAHCTDCVSDRDGMSDCSDSGYSLEFVVSKRTDSPGLYRHLLALHDQPPANRRIPAQRVSDAHGGLLGCGWARPALFSTSTSVNSTWSISRSATLRASSSPAAMLR
ncbi:MAG: hypothetical protein KatS3mg055_2310 [Chloroflexus sp.]|nr:hypothetical protein [Chloroflexus sp.]GIV89792.1 MAG: hypothetical protein KatS3mg055_2310 [Chloroflexus sp.]